TAVRWVSGFSWVVIAPTATSLGVNCLLAISSPTFLQFAGDLIERGGRHESSRLHACKLVRSFSATGDSYRAWEYRELLPAKQSGRAKSCNLRANRGWPSRRPS